VRKDHPLRAVRVMTDEILESMSPLFDAMYCRVRSAIDCAGEVVAGTVIANAVLGA